MEREKKLFHVSARTTEAVKQAVEAESRLRNWSQSEVMHVALSRYYGLDPLTGAPVSADEPAGGPAASR